MTNYPVCPTFDSWPCKASIADLTTHWILALWNFCPKFCTPASINSLDHILPDIIWRAEGGKSFLCNYFRLDHGIELSLRDLKCGLFNSNPRPDWWFVLSSGRKCRLTPMVGCLLFLLEEEEELMASKGEEANWTMKLSVQDLMKGMRNIIVKDSRKDRAQLMIPALGRNSSLSLIAHSLSCLILDITCTLWLT